MSSHRTPDRIGGLSRDAVSQHRKMYLGSVALSAVALLVSLVASLRAVEQEQAALALTVAETYAAETVALRSWVSEQGGLLVPESESARPNPHLPAELRTRITDDGQRLTLLNPAHLTRILGERTERVSGTRIRLTAAEPLRPENAPDPWEAAALAQLGGGEGVLFEVVERDGAERFRYLAALAAEPSCLASCHPAPESGSSTVFGAIAVDCDYAPFREASRRQQRFVWGSHAALVAVALAVLTALSQALRRSLLRLAKAGVRIGDLEQLLPICASCKRVRVEADEPEDGRWVQLEDYVHRSVDAATFSHGVCPHCVHELDDSSG